jgi:hypothetical protein
MVLIINIATGLVAVFILVVWWLKTRKGNSTAYISIDEKYRRRTLVNRQKRGKVSTINYYRRLLILAVTYINEKYGITIKDGIGKEERNALRLQGMGQTEIEGLSLVLQQLRSLGRTRQGGYDDARLWLLYGDLAKFFKHQAQAKAVTTDHKED